MEQRSSEWFQVRAGKITGSRFSHAMARKDTAKYQDLISTLVAERTAGKYRDDGYVNSAMQWGMNHEDTARSWYASKYRRKVNEIGFVIHPKYQYIGVSPDGLVGNNGLIEIKCPQHNNFLKVKESKLIPSHYRWQVQGQLWVCGRDWTDFVCFYPPKDGVVIRMEADEDDFAALEERCCEINMEVDKRIRSQKNATHSSGYSNKASIVNPGKYNQPHYINNQSSSSNELHVNKSKSDPYKTYKNDEKISKFDSLLYSLKELVISFFYLAVFVSIILLIFD